jgi:hypothetical protein|tara:strand:- start:761 stop:1336 length:576 start_codon:yes stop_codon:yes gene_type:complete
MLLHFIFVIKDKELGQRELEFEYIKRMAQFFKIWIKKKFSLDFDIQCDQMITKPRIILQRLDTHSLLKDHRERGEDVYHFYLCHFRPLWTDCTCEGYHAENFGMIKWVAPPNQDDMLFLAEKNCAVVSHEIAHELLRQSGYKRFMEDIHEVWGKHLFGDFPFEQYGEDFEITSKNPSFLTLDTGLIDKNES